MLLCIEKYILMSLDKDIVIKKSCRDQCIAQAFINVILMQGKIDDDGLRNLL